MARMNWETARRREYVRVHGGDRVAPESRASGTFRRSSWNTTCKVCGGRIAKGQSCYLVRPGVLCKPCAGGLIRRGELPNDARSTKGRAKLGEFRRRLAAGAVTSPPRPKKRKKPRVTQQQQISPRPRRKLELDNRSTSIKQHFIEQQARLRARPR